MCAPRMLRLPLGCTSYSISLSSLSRFAFQSGINRWEDQSKQCAGPVAVPSCDDVSPNLRHLPNAIAPKESDGASIAGIHSHASSDGSYTSSGESQRSSGTQGSEGSACLPLRPSGLHEPFAGPPCTAPLFYHRAGGTQAPPVDTPRGMRGGAKINLPGQGRDAGNSTSGVSRAVGPTQGLGDIRFVRNG